MAAAVLSLREYCELSMEVAFKISSLAIFNDLP
jgi:hypothetical protein